MAAYRKATLGVTSARQSDWAIADLPAGKYEALVLAPTTTADDNRYHRGDPGRYDHRLAALVRANSPSQREGRMMRAIVIGGRSADSPQLWFFEAGAGTSIFWNVRRIRWKGAGPESSCTRTRLGIFSSAQADR